MENSFSLLEGGEVLNIILQDVKCMDTQRLPYNKKDKACICYIPISEVEAVGRTVVAWRWSIVHLIRHIWPGRALLEERQWGNFHKDGNKGFDSPLIPHSCCCHATNFSSSLLLGEGDGPWIFYTALQVGCQRAKTDSSCAFHISFSHFTKPVPK